MRNREFELRKRVLEAQFQADVELLRAGYEAKLRALEMLWLRPGEEELPAAPGLLSAGTALRLSEPAAESAAPPPAASPALPSPPPPPAQPAIQRGQVVDDLDAILPQLPEVFDARDVERALGYKPPRATLYRAISRLLANDRVVREREGLGPRPTSYRRLPES